MMRHAKLITRPFQRRLLVVVVLILRLWPLLIRRYSRRRRASCRVLLRAPPERAVFIKILAKKKAKDHHEVDVIGLFVAKDIPKLV